MDMKGIVQLLESIIEIRDINNDILVFSKSNDVKEVHDNENNCYCTVYDLPKSLSITEEI